MSMEISTKETPMHIDLSHTFEDGMPGFTMRTPEGREERFTASVKPFLTHVRSLHRSTKDRRPSN